MDRDSIAQWKKKLTDSFFETCVVCVRGQWRLEGWRVAGFGFGDGDWGLGIMLCWG